MSLRYLFVDFNSYFASVEQYDQPALRGRPIAVAPVDAETTCCIAASYEAKAYGVKTGTSVAQARLLCPDIRIVAARPALYIKLHHQLMAAIEECAHHEPPLSIDEVPCRLIGSERQRDNAIAIAHKIKQRFVALGYSPAIRCSIGIGPNIFLAKTASDMQKPDGLTVLEAHALPQILFPLALNDLCGIGPAMHERLIRAGIHSVEALCQSSREQLRRIWGGIEGERFWAQLHGADLPSRKNQRSSVGHSHVLGPELRSIEGARAVLFKLLAKAAMRMRGMGMQASSLSVRIRFIDDYNHFAKDFQFAPLSDSPSLLQLLSESLHELKDQHHKPAWYRLKPLSVAVTLSKLQSVQACTGSLFDANPRQHALTQVLDKINHRYGNNALYFATMQTALINKAAPMRIPFSQIPDVALEDDHDPRLKSKPNYKGVFDKGLSTGQVQKPMS